MIESRASNSFTNARALPEKKRISPFVWMNLVCLDAPLLALSWQTLFARSFHLRVSRGATAALFLTAWFIYLADRLGDALSLVEHGPTSLRQRFCLSHLRAWIAAVALVGLLDSLIVVTQLDRVAVAVGGSVGALAFVYLLINRLRPSVWRIVPLKEISIGGIFAAGTMVGLLRGLTTSALPPWLSFAALCSMNCISIAVWECELDQTQGRISITTEFPRVARFLLPVLAAICLTNAALAIARGPAGAIHLCVAFSAFFLGAVHLLRNSIQSDTRTALADLVLLTPVVALLVV